MIKSASEVWSSQTNRDEFEKSCSCVMKKIEEASAEGYRECCFNPCHYQHYDAVKQEFLKRGYRFKPTGYCGGVWQDSEQICW